MHPFLWDNGRMIDLGSLGGTLGFAFALNNRGQVAGISNLAGDTFAHGYLWDGRALKDLGTFGGDTSEADSLNNAGEVVGVADFPGDQVHDGFLWRNGVMIDLGNLGVTSHAYSINSSSQVVGNSRIDSTNIRAFLWERGEIADLNDLVSPKSDVVLVDVNAIADSGEILVNGLPPDCTAEDVCGHAYVLIPRGDMDEDNDARIADTQSKILASRWNATSPQNLVVVKQRSEMPNSPLERFRSLMRQRYHLPGQPAAPRD
jgi:probable HAF family extracellular repeat protein